jgi:hypothetical protein
MNDNLRDAVRLFFGTHKETILNYRSFEMSKSIRLQVVGEISGDPHASERLKAVFWSKRANFGDVKKKRDNADANKILQAEHQQVVDLHTELQHLQDETATAHQLKQRALV